MSKYGNIKTRVGDLVFDSKKEAERYTILRLMERAGQIKDLRMQVPFELVPKQTAPDGKSVRPIVYKADFCYYDYKGYHVEDVKGTRTKEYRIKKKLMLHVHGIWIEEV